MNNYYNELAKCINSSWKSKYAGDYWKGIVTAEAVVQGAAQSLIEPYKIMEHYVILLQSF